jgi:hypothetical protein
MKSDYLCPHCNGYLNIGEDLIFKIKCSNGKAALLILHTDIENYSVKFNSAAIKIQKGEKTIFLCPLCQKSLDNKAHDNLARIIMRTPKGNECAIVFSKIYGEHCTYKFVGQDMLSFGEQAKKYYLDPEWFQ